MQTGSYLGKGLQFPIVIDGGAAQWSEGRDRIPQSINVILGSAISTLFMNRDFASRVREALFEPNDEVLESLLDICLVEAIEKWEKRIELTSVDYTQTDALCLCKINYRILLSNEIDSFVYPFYKNKLNN